MMIASRELTLKTEDGDHKIPIRIFAPDMEKEGAWSCRFEIDWPDKKSDKTIWGYDAMQAIVLASQIIGAEIYTSSYHESGKLYWDKPGNGYGFPVAPTLRDLLQGDDAKYL